MSDKWYHRMIMTASIVALAASAWDHDQFMMIFMAACVAMNGDYVEPKRDSVT